MFVLLHLVFCATLKTGGIIGIRKCQYLGISLDLSVSYKCYQMKK